MYTHRYAYYGNSRPGTNRYEFGGGAYGGWRGLGDGGTTTPAAVAVVPAPQPIQTEMVAMQLVPGIYSDVLKEQALQAQGNAITAAALNNNAAFATNQAVAQALATQAVEAEAGAAPAGTKPTYMPLLALGVGLLIWTSVRQARGARFRAAARRHHRKHKTANSLFRI